MGTPDNVKKLLSDNDGNLQGNMHSSTSGLDALTFSTPAHIVLQNLLFIATQDRQQQHGRESSSVFSRLAEENHRPLLVHTGCTGRAGAGGQSSSRGGAEAAVGTDRSRNFGHLSLAVCAATPLLHLPNALSVQKQIACFL